MDLPLDSKYVKIRKKKNKKIVSTNVSLLTNKPSTFFLLLLFLSKKVKGKRE